MSEALIEVAGLSKAFPIRGGLFGSVRGAVNAVNDVSFRLEKGEVFGLAGESGSGKSTIARMILGLVTPSAGDILIEGRDFLSERDWRKRSDAVQMVFQNPGSSLNPRRSIGQSIAVPLQARRVPPPRRPPTRRARCSSRCNCRRISPSAILTNSPAARSSARRSRARSRSSRSSSCSTSRPRRSTSRCKPRSSNCSTSCAAGSASPTSSSRTTFR